MAFSISVKLTLIFLIIAPCLAYVIYLIMHITIPQYKNIQKKLDKTNLMTSETLTGARVIRAFSRQKDEEKSSLIILKNLDVSRLSQEEFPPL